MTEPQNRRTVLKSIFDGVLDDVKASAGQAVGKAMDVLVTGGQGQAEHDLICLSHLRWDFVFQRPQHLMTRFARSRRVYYFEEPVFASGATPALHHRKTPQGPVIVVPHLPSGMKPADVRSVLEALFEQMLEDEGIKDMTLWYYTPMALEFTRHLEPAAVVFDCMDELSAFKNAPPDLVRLEAELMKRADVVFTGGHSLYEAKKHRHANIHPVPSSIDRDHFASARVMTAEPADQAAIPRPRIGFFGVLDERFDVELIKQSSLLRPDWHFVLIGPIVKIHADDLPQGPNIHYLGQKDYKVLPSYLTGWEAAILPFARNESTRFISPTKTPEYLAAGRPVVSTSITDVVRPYGELGLVKVADEPEAFVAAIAAAIRDFRPDSPWMKKVDRFLRRGSWDETQKTMAALEQAFVTQSRRAAKEAWNESKQPYAAASFSMMESLR